MKAAKRPREKFKQTLGFYYIAQVMPYKIITQEFDPEQCEFDQTLLDEFFVNKRVKSIQPHFFQQQDRSYWTIWVEYDPLLKPIEKRKPNIQLKPLQQQCFDQLKLWRKEKADQEKIPAYVIANDRELLSIVDQLPKSIEALNLIPGFGAKKIKKHGQDILSIIKPYNTSIEQTNIIKPSDEQNS